MEQATLVKQAQGVLAAASDPAAELVGLALFAVKVVGWGVGVLVLALVGWAASSLHVLATWPEAALAARLEILRGMLVAIVTGAIAALGGMYCELPMVLILIGVLLAGYSGERWLRPLADAVLGRVTSAFEALFGRKP